MERQTQVNIRLHLEEKAAILKRAKEEKLSLSDFMRRAALGATGRPLPEEVSQALRETKTVLPDVPPMSTEELKGIDPRLAVEPTDALAKRVKQLVTSGTSQERAERQAKKEWGL